jgi:ribonuclease P protein component
VGVLTIASDSTFPCLRLGMQNERPVSASRTGAGNPFPRSLRLLRHADFERVYEQGRRHFATHMTVFYLRRAEGDGLRVGFTVSRALGGAVERNRMKRRLRESVRLCRPLNYPAVDVVINPKKSLLTADFAELKKEVTRAFEVIAQKLAERQK